MNASGLPSFLDIGTNVVTLIVGAAQKRHVVYHDLLVKESPYFRAMLQGSWKETAKSNKPISLPLADHRVFPYFLNWLYFRRFHMDSDSLQHTDLCQHCGLPGCSKVAPASPSASSHGASFVSGDDARLETALNFIDESTHPISLYIFADKFDVPALREEIVNMWWCNFVRTGLVVGYYCVINSFRNLPESSPLCRLVLDMCVDKWRAETDEACACSMEVDLRSKLPSNFLFLLAAEQAKKIAGDVDQALGPLCKYHEHAQDEEAIAACKKRTAERARKGREVHPDWDALEKVRVGVESGSESEMED